MSCSRECKCTFSTVRQRLSCVDQAGLVPGMITTSCSTLNVNATHTPVCRPYTLLLARYTSR